MKPPEEYPRYYYLFNPENIGCGSEILYIKFIKPNHKGTIYFKNSSPQDTAPYYLNEENIRSDLKKHYREVTAAELALII